MPELLTPREAAAELRIAVQTLARWRCEGGGPAYIRMGGKVLYRLADLEAWVASRRVRATSQRAPGDTLKHRVAS